MIELPVTVRAEPDEVIQGVHHRDRCVERKRRQRTFVTDLDVFVIAAANAPAGKRRKVETTSVLPQTRVPAGRMVGAIGDGTHRLGSIEPSIGPVFGTVLVPSRNRDPAHAALPGWSTLRDQDVVLLGGARPRTELRIPGIPAADRTYGHGNPERGMVGIGCRSHGASAGSIRLLCRDCTVTT